MKNRIEVMHGVNLDQVGRRDPRHYGHSSFDELETRIGGWARERSLSVRFFQSNHEGEFVEHLHKLDGLADAAIINAGAWTHYAWAIRDAVELTGLPMVEVHLSDVSKREEWRQKSIFDGLVLTKIAGKGPDGYREALDLLSDELKEERPT